MNADYFKQAIPEPFRVLGLHLKYLSIGRYCLMKRHGIAFVSDDEVAAEAKDLILGVLICSQRVDDFNAWMELPINERQKDLRKWGNKVAGRFVRKKNIPSLVIHMQMFRAYIRANYAMPQYWDESGSERTSAAHWSHAVEVVLRSELNWSREEINEQPLSKALMDYFKWAENQGAIRLMTQSEVEQGEANARIMEQFLAAGNN